MKHVLTTLMVIGALIFLAAPAMADWDRNDPYKMHYPQMPNPDGWDVNISLDGDRVADDWKCSGTGPVDDIHFWGSWRHDDVAVLKAVYVGIWDNEPAPATGGFSHPRTLLWDHWFQEEDIVVREPPDNGDQGWYDPPEAIRPDHKRYFQVNITNIQDILAPQGKDAFVQKEGEIYWLELGADVAGAEEVAFGWKTSLDYYEDIAVHQVAGGWEPLSIPGTPDERLDMAFVITPEPSTVVMLVSAGLMGLLACVRYRRKR